MLWSLLRYFLTKPFHSHDLKANSPNLWSYIASLAIHEKLVLYQDNIP